MTAPDPTSPDSPDPPDVTARARGLLEAALASEVAVDSAAAALVRLGGDVARAGTRREAARSGAHVAAQRDRVNELLDELAEIAASADRLGAALGVSDGHGDAPGARRGAEARAILGSVRRVVQAAGDRGREGVWMGRLATDRMRDLAEFELLYSQASADLDHGELDAADAVLPRLVALDRALVSMEVGVMLDEVKFRLLTARG